MKELYHRDTFTLLYDEEIPCIIYRISRLPKSSEAVREGGKNLLRACQEYPVKSILVDARGSMGVLYEDVEWSSLYITPRLIQAGVKQVAIISDNNDTLKMSVQEHLELTINAPLIQQVFQTEEEAREWLKQQMASLIL